MTNSCPQCGYTNPNNATRCAQCNSPLTQTCAQCRFENPGSFKFCGNCGAKLQAAPARVTLETRGHSVAPVPDALAQKISTLGKQLEGERRNVTVLFSDISGFTTIAEKLDPEQVYELIDTTLKAFTDEIYRYEGTIDKVLGDGVMALFGAPIAHEDAIGERPARVDGDAHVSVRCRIFSPMHRGATRTTATRCRAILQNRVHRA